MLPSDFASWQTVYYYFRKWKLEGVFEEAMDILHIIVDTLGLPLAVAIHEASLHDSKGAPQAIEKLVYKFPRLAKILADGGYRGDWLIGSRRNSDGYWRSYSGRTNVHLNFKYCPNAGLWNALSHGWKTSEG